MNGTTTFIGRAMATMVLSICMACTMFAGSAYGRQDQGVNVTDVGTIDLAVQDTDLAQVLQMLSMQTKKNIIASRNVSGTVTANLYNVTFHEALESILRSNGFRYLEEIEVFINKHLPPKEDTLGDKRALSSMESPMAGKQ